MCQSHCVHPRSNCQWKTHRQRQTAYGRGTLIAIMKPNGRSRPVVVGELFVRLASACLLQDLKSNMRTFFPRIQLGLTQGGSEKASLALQGGLSYVKDPLLDDDQPILLSVDITNAFNTIPR